MHVVVLFGAGAPSAAAAVLQGEGSRLDAWRVREDLSIAAITTGMPEGLPGATHHLDVEVGTTRTDRLWRALGAFTLHRTLAKSPIGRLLNSMGPVDQGRVFWRTIRRHPEALRALRYADAVVAADAAAVKTAWMVLRRGWCDAAFYDRRAASALLNVAER